VQATREKQATTQEVQAGQHRDGWRPRSLRSSVRDSDHHSEVRRRAKRSRPRRRRHQRASTGDFDTKVRRTARRSRPRRRRRWCGSIGTVSVSGAGDAPSSTSTSNSDKPSLGEHVFIVGKLYFTKEQLARRSGRRGSLLPRHAVASATWRTDAPTAHAEVPRVVRAEVPRVVPPVSARPPRTTNATIVVGLATGPGSATS
jgi:hypothetical protein